MNTTVFLRRALVALHVLAFAFYVPLGLVMPPLGWSVALAGAAIIAGAGGRAAHRSPMASTALLFLTALWWGVAQVVLPVSA